MKYKAIIFDLDGTLTDTLDDLTDSINYALAKHGFNTQEKRNVRMFVGNGLKNLTRRALPTETSDKIVDLVNNTLVQYYQEHSLIKTKPYPFIVDLLKSLHNDGIKIGIVSNKPDPDVKRIADHFFNGLIDVAIGETKTIARKPSKDMLLKALDILNCNNDEVVYVGDSEVDIMFAKNANVKCISVTWGFRDSEVLINNGAVTLIDSVDSLDKEINK